MVARRRALLVLAALGAMLTAGCTADRADPGPDPSEPPSATASASPTTPPPAPPPKKGACYDLAPGQLTGAHDDSTPVKCGKHHTTQTYAVKKMSRRTIGDPSAIDTETVARAADRRCTRALRKHLGAGKEEMALSRLRSAWFVPEEQEFARGARWLRCDVLAHRTADSLARLPRRTEGLLDSEGALDKWGTCAKASPRRLGAGKGQRMCSEKHNWRAVSIRTLGKKSERWPGARSVRKDVLDRCEDAVRSFTGNKTRTASVGWLPPTKRQWKSGRRYGICWAETG
ncbi:MAG: septum formation family protein [Nocardioidaceae bacterium]